MYVFSPICVVLFSLFGVHGVNIALIAPYRLNLMRRNVETASSVLLSHLVFVRGASALLRFPQIGCFPYNLPPRCIPCRCFYFGAFVLTSLLSPDYIASGGRSHVFSMRFVPEFAVVAGDAVLSSLNPALAALGVAESDFLRRRTVHFDVFIGKFLVMWITSGLRYGVFTECP